MDTPFPKTYSTEIHVYVQYTQFSSLGNTNALKLKQAHSRLLNCVIGNLIEHENETE